MWVINKKRLQALSLGPFSGLRARVVLLFAGLTALLILLLGLVVVRIVQHNLLHQKRVQGRMALTAMQSAIDLVNMPLDRGRPIGAAGLNAIVKTVVSNLEIHSLVIVDREQSVIGHSQQEMLGLVLAEEELQRAMAERKLLYRIVGAGSDISEMIFFGPLYREGAVVGAARFSLTLDDLRNTLAGTKRLLVLYAIFDAVLVVLIGSLALLRFLVQPVEAMVRETEQMAAGDYRFVGSGRGQGEIGRLSRALTKLAQTLRDKQEMVQRQLQRLERINAELKEAHDQLLHSDRLAYVGRIAAGVAHEVGNPLGAIYGYLEILRGSEMPPPGAEVLARLEAELQRIDRTMRELLDFSRSKPAQTAAADLRALTREAVQLMKSQRGLDRIAVRLEENAAVPAVQVDPAQFKQVILNLLLNAADAMEGSGSIEIAMATAPYDRLMLLEPLLPGAPHESQVPFTDAVHRGIVFSERLGPPVGTHTVQLHITDSGPGIKPGILEHIFDPFFTTKPQGKGTGLGLAICQRIVSSVGGLIRVESREGRGTRVTLIFPALGEEAVDG